MPSNVKWYQKPRESCKLRWNTEAPGAGGLCASDMLSQRDLGEWAGRPWGWGCWAPSHPIIQGSYCLPTRSCPPSGGHADPLGGGPPQAVYVGTKEGGRQIFWGLTRSRLWGLR